MTYTLNPSFSCEKIRAPSKSKIHCGQGDNAFIDLVVVVTLFVFNIEKFALADVRKIFGTMGLTSKTDSESKLLK